MNFNYHIHKSDIKCPYCDKDYQDDDYVAVQQLEQRIELECEHCGKVFWVESCIVYNTYSDCKLNGDEHIFKNDCEQYPTVFNCENCYESEVRSQTQPEGD